MRGTRTKNLIVDDTVRRFAKEVRRSMKYEEENRAALRGFISGEKPIDPSPKDDEQE